MIKPPCAGHLAAIEALLEARIVAVAALERRSETRLRFNAPTPVEAWRLRLRLRPVEGADYACEIEVFHWLVDDEWELVEALA